MIDENVFRGRRLCVVGNICRDLKTAPLSPGDYLFHDGETPTERLVDTLGGGGANSALAAAHLGAEVRFAGKVGADALGNRLESALLHGGVQPFLRHDRNVQTGSSLALSWNNGCRHFISCQPNNAGLDLCDIDLAVLDGGEHLLRADIWFSERMLNDGNARLLQAARERGLATSLDLNWDPLWNSASEETIRARMAAVRDVLPLVDLAHGNVRELNRFADSTDLATTLRRLTTWGAAAVVVHMGAEGAGYYAADELTVEPGRPVQRQVNTTGCGDLLSVCLMLLHRRDDISVVEKLRLANRIVAEFIEGKRNPMPAL
jgi:sugar/nucleoside kinase (ribokinase family)